MVKAQPFCDVAEFSEHTSIVFNVLGVTRSRDTETPWGLVVPPRLQNARALSYAQQ